VSERVVLRVRGPLEDAIDLDGITPDRLASLSESAIAQLPVWRGRDRANLGDLFEVRGGHAAAVVIEGAEAQVHGIGAGMTGGTLMVEGDAGDLVGAGMSGGVLQVNGAIGHDGGVGMSGGVLEVVGNCGDRLGGARPGTSRGMSGGEIVVRGHAGTSAGARCRRGLLVVAGDVGHSAAHAMIAGSLFVFGRTGAGAAQFNRRGSLVALGSIEVPQTYRYACRYRPPHVRVTLLYLARRYGVAVDPRYVGGHYVRYCGDRVGPGKGEILVWAPAG
jgi:formylmethanofuran dehydrogenase subunit C